MMSPQTFRLVLLVSFAHAFVHIYELALPAVEQFIGEEYAPDRSEEFTGTLGLVARIPFGGGAILVGWLSDKFGAKPMLVIYLLGCAFTAIMTYFCPSAGMMFGLMFLMGAFGSIYHPAGLALISQETKPENRSRALGIHGICGGLGQASAPFIAALVLMIPAFTWRHYYLALAIPGIILALIILWKMPRTLYRKPEAETKPIDDDDHESYMKWNVKRYAMIVACGALGGYVYAGFMHFLARYLSDANVEISFIAKEKFGTFMASGVLLFGVAGQAFAGRIARPATLEKMFSCVLFCNVPLLVLMAFVEGPWRFVITAALAFVHFMNQPLYNSIVASFVPTHRRSLGFGISSFCCFGIGALGPFVAGLLDGPTPRYLNFAVAAFLSGSISAILHFTKKKES